MADAAFSLVVIGALCAALLYVGLILKAVLLTCAAVHRLFTYWSSL
jgi:hypothetical protein